MFTLAIVIFLVPELISAQCKDLDLAWATYSGTHDEGTEICNYSNVRFAGPPTGMFRFMEPQDPQQTHPAPPEEPVSCVQVDTTAKCTSGGDLFIVNDNCPNTFTGQAVEDCLFLDMCPLIGSEWNRAGSCSRLIPLYSGQGILTSTQENLIFVVGNYRLGAFGWLAGTYMENEARPNAGLYDQRKILEFVNQYISKVNGNATQVSAWGESAGASSILHHLIANNGSHNPLFSKAVLQSLAFEWQWNRTGSLNDTYTTFAGLAGCPAGDLPCLQSASETTLSTANRALFVSDVACLGVFPLGPSLDSDIILTIPAVTFQNGHYWAELESIIVSHVSDEVSSKSRFIPYPIRQDPNSTTNFDKFLTTFMPGPQLANVRGQIEKQYPSGDYSNQVYRVAALINNSSFTCNTRQLFDAYNGKIPTYMMNYHFLADYDAAVHASDLLPTFCNNDINVADLLINCANIEGVVARVIGPYMRTTFAPGYQSYLKSHAIHGDPNTGAIGLAAQSPWNVATTSSDDNHDHVRNVMQPQYVNKSSLNPFQIASKDPNNTATFCGFWNDIASEIMQIVGNPHA